MKTKYLIFYKLRVIIILACSRLAVRRRIYTIV